MKQIIPALLLAVLAFGCKDADKKAASKSNVSTFVNPPMPGVEPTFADYTVDAGLGDTMVHHSGTMLLFQPGAFLDKAGKVVSGNVNVRYREFNSPVDFYLAGIPMNYDSSGTGYTLESSGMCEVLAFKDGEPVFVNPDRKPEIVYASNTDAPGHNVYYLDTVKNNWVYEKPSRAIAVSSTAIISSAPSTTDPGLPSPPLQPVKAEVDRPVIKIVIDTASFKELKVYDNLKFQVDKSEKNFRPEDADEYWTDVELQKADKGGLYKIKFTNPKRTVVYSARPVLEGEDYNKALKTFEKNNSQYKKDIKARLSRDAKAKAQYEKDTLRNLELERENLRIAELNRLAERHNRRIDSLDAAIVADNQRRIDERNARIDGERFSRAFAIAQFGVYNCDKPLTPDFLPITANFVDGSGAPLTVTYVSVVYQNINSVVPFFDNRIRISKSGDVMIFGKVDGRLAYMDFATYRNLTRLPGDTALTIPLSLVEKENNNYEYIAKLASGMK